MMIGGEYFKMKRLLFKLEDILSTERMSLLK